MAEYAPLLVLVTSVLPTSDEERRHELTNRAFAATGGAPGRSALSASRASPRAGFSHLRSQLTLAAVDRPFAPSQRAGGSSMPRVRRPARRLWRTKYSSRSREAALSTRCSVCARVNNRRACAVPLSFVTCRAARRNRIAGPGSVSEQQAPALWRRKQPPRARNRDQRYPTFEPSPFAVPHASGMHVALEGKNSDGW